MKEISTVILQKGLYFVYIYGIYEETIRQVVSTTIDELNNAEVKLMSAYMNYIL